MCPPRRPCAAQGKLEIDLGTGMNARERGAHPGLRRQIGGKRGGGDVERGEAYAADGATVSGAQLLGYVLRLDHDAAVLSVLIDAGDASDFLDNSSKHDGSSSQPCGRSG